MLMHAKSLKYLLRKRNGNGNNACDYSYLLTKTDTIINFIILQIKK